MYAGLKMMSQSQHVTDVAGDVDPFTLDSHVIVMGSIGRRPSSREGLIATSAAVLASWVSYRFIRWRARKQARRSVNRFIFLGKEGPLVDPLDSVLCKRILAGARDRSDQWRRFVPVTPTAGSGVFFQPLEGQVGGLSAHKPPLLALPPDSILKPLPGDARAIREIAFYEALHLVRSNSAVSRMRGNGSPGTTLSQKYYAHFLQSTTHSSSSSTGWSLSEFMDSIALVLATSIQDPIVAASEQSLKSAWKKIEREVEALQQLSKWTASYRGIWQDRSPSLWLEDLTRPYKHPCVMDLKIGTHTYEPDAPPKKVRSETSKYHPQQLDFGFRLVGMRVYHPSTDDDPKEDYRFYDKVYGRSLATRQQVLEAFRIFFTSRTGRLCHEAVSSLLFQLRPIHSWFSETNRSLAFCASSLLIAYESGSDGGGTENSPQTSNQYEAFSAVTVKMIDFGRVRRCATGDPGYLHGLEQLMECLTDFLEQDGTRRDMTTT